MLLVFIPDQNSWLMLGTSCALRGSTYRYHTVKCGNLDVWWGGHPSATLNINY